MTIDPRLIIQMLAIARHGSISRAAVALRMSQPALSNSVSQLERHLGVAVVERTRHGSKMTDIGWAVARCAGAMEARIQSLVEELKVRNRGGTGTLNIGMTPVVGFSFVPEAVAKLTELMPGLSVSMKEFADDQLSELLTKGAIDLAICPIGVGLKQAEIKEESLFTDAFSLVVRKGHRLSRSTAVTLTDIVDELWIFPHAGSAFRMQIEAIFLTCGFSVPANSVNTNSGTLLEKLLLRTDRVAIMSDWYIRSLDRKLFSRVALHGVGIP